MADDIGTMAVKITAITDPLKAGLSQAIQNLKRFEDQVGKTMAPPPGLRDVTAGVRDLHKDLDKVHKTAGFVKTSLAGLALKGAVAGASFGAGLVGLDLLGSVKDFAVGSVQAAADAEKMQAAFEVMTGSGDKAVAVLGKLRAYAKDSPLGTDTVLNTAKQLAAYGIAADQLAPTLRMLGDAAAGDSERLKSIALAYGQVATTGRLMGDDLRQFNAAGVPLAEELAKALGKPKEMVKLLVEEGKVGFPDVVKAFRSMTGEGGRFFGMSEKYAGTFAGSMENLTDAWQSLKREFGTAIIEETGLKEATKDLSAFTDRVRAGVNEVRPAIRFVGDLARAGAQVGNEFGKAAGSFLDIQVRALEKEFPGFGSGIRGLIDDFKQFKIDPDKVIAAGYDFSIHLVYGAKVLYESLSNIGDKAQDWMRPIVDAARDFRAAAEAWGQAKDRTSKTLDHPAVGIVSAPYAILRKELTREASEGMAKAAADDRLSGYTGGNPRERAGALTAKPASLNDWFGGMQEKLERMKNDQLRASAENKVRQAAERQAAAQANSYLPGAAIVGGAFDAVAESAKKAAKELDRVQVPADTHARAVQLGARLNEHLRDPLDKFNEVMGDVSFLASRGLLDDRTRSLAVAEALDDAARNLGHFQLPNAAEYGSREAARVQAEALAGKAGDDAVGLLKEIRDYEKAREERARRLEGQVVSDRLNKLSEATVFDWP